MESVTEYLSYDEAARRINLPVHTLLDRIRAEEVPIFIDGRDRRRRLIDVRDLPKLIEPRPIPQAKTA